MIKPEKFYTVPEAAEKFGVNRLAAMCAIDRATLVTVCDYWAPGVGVTGIHELVGNALVMTGEKKDREVNLRLEPISEAEQEEANPQAKEEPANV